MIVLYLEREKELKKWIRRDIIESLIARDRENRDRVEIEGETDRPVSTKLTPIELISENDYVQLGLTEKSPVSEM